MSAEASPAVSVALSVYNGARFLAPAIESVLAQSFPDFELLLLDDGSQDATPAIIQGYAARDPRIRPIIRANRGLVASLNELIDTARAPLIARMDADDLCHPERFARQIAFLAAHPDHGVLGTATQDIDEHDAPWPCHALPYEPTHQGILRRLANGGPVLCHPSVMMRRDVALQVGLYHAAFRHCEDLDLWLRLASVTKLANLDEPLLRYRHYPEQVSSRHATEQQVGAAIARLAWAERQAGRPDPTARLDRLPPVEQLDALFGRPGVTREVRAAIAGNLLYSAASLRDEGFDIILGHIRESGARRPQERHYLWRTVARLMRFGEPSRAARLAATLALH